MYLARSFPLIQSTSLPILSLFAILSHNRVTNWSLLFINLHASCQAMRLLILGLLIMMADASGFFDPVQLKQEVRTRFNSTNGSVTLVDSQGRPTSDHGLVW